ncbi:hypothetical protein BH09BAC1_BH09BAC1_11430 [soil metagenome]
MISYGLRVTGCGLSSMCFVFNSNERKGDLSQRAQRKFNRNERKGIS